MENRVSITISANAKKNITNAIHTLNMNLPEMVNLSSEERRTLPKMGDKSVAFVSKALEYSKQNPDVIPPYLDVNLFEIDFNAVHELLNILHPLKQLVEKLEDTAMLSGTEAYEAALIFYHSVNGAAKADVPGMKTIYEDLRQRFPRKHKQEEENTEDNQNEEPTV